jgi:hypothetical protein
VFWGSYPNGDQGAGLASSAPHHREDERLIAWTFEHGHRAVCSGVLIGSLLDVLEVEAVVEVVQRARAGGGGGLASSAWHKDQMGPPYRTDVWVWDRSVCSGGCQFEVLEERVLAERGLVH